MLRRREQKTGIQVRSDAMPATHTVKIGAEVPETGEKVIPRLCIKEGSSRERDQIVWSTIHSSYQIEDVILHSFISICNLVQREERKSG